MLLDTGDVVCPDVLGWRREHCPARPTGTPVTLRPDWICEVSASNANDDTIKKLRLYYRVAVLRDEASQRGPCRIAADPRSKRWVGA